MILAPVAPFDHTTVPAQVLFVDSVASSPAHSNVLLVAIVIAVGLPTVIVNGSEFPLSQVPTLHFAV